ncbi:MAG: hypothetical protein AB1798_15030 [Spirochaetota bacterium]
MLVRKMKTGGIDSVLKDVCKIDPDEKLAALIKKSFNEITNSKKGFRIKV